MNEKYVDLQIDIQRGRMAGVVENMVGSIVNSERIVKVKEVRGI